jgi:hypothetical protein
MTRWHNTSVLLSTPVIFEPLRISGSGLDTPTGFDIPPYRYPDTGDPIAYVLFQPS